MKKHSIIIIFISLLCFQSFGQTNIEEENDSSSIISVPSSFTPNADGVHDILLLEGSEHVETLSFSVFNRWGEVMFETDNTSIAWNGETKGQACAVGVYYWTLDAVLTNGEEVALKGKLSLLR